MADEWSPPAGVTPQQYRQEPSGGVEQLLNMIDRQKRELDEMRSSLLKTAGLSVEPGLLRVMGALAVDGTMEVAGDAVFSGDLAVPNGSITNAALASPIATDVGSAATAPSTAIGGSLASYAPVSIAVPAGFGTAVVVANSLVSFAGSAVGVEVRTRIDGSDGVAMVAFADGTYGAGNGGATNSRKYAVTPGGTITISTMAFASGGTASGVLSTSASVSFYR